MVTFAMQSVLVPQEAHCAIGLGDDEAFIQDMKVNNNLRHSHIII